LDAAPTSSNRSQGTDLRAAREVIERHDDLGISLADALIVVFAVLNETGTVLTLDKRDVRALTANGKAVTPGARRSRRRRPGHRTTGTTEGPSRARAVPTEASASLTEGVAEAPAG